MSERSVQVRKDGIRLSWTDEEIDFVFDCLSSGMTASVTAMAMVDKGMRSDCLPITRNAIVGIWNRDKERKDKCQKAAKLKGKPIRKSKKKKAGKFVNTLLGIHSVYSPIPPTKPKVYPIPDDGVTLVELKNMSCRFPYGEPSKEMRYCGHPVAFEKTKSYCMMHYQICYVQSRRSRNA